MNPFQSMVSDIFNITEFVEYFRFNDNLTVKCICYETTDELAYSEFGYTDGVSFYLTCKVSDFTPHKGDKITYRNKEYKIDSFTTDSFHLCYTLYLKDLNSK